MRRDVPASRVTRTVRRRCEIRAALVEPLECRTLMSLPSGFAQATFATGITAPTAMAFAPDGRLFVTEQDGDVRVVTRQGQLLSAPFARVAVRNDGEQGLIGIAFHPDFATNGWLYLHYATPEALNRVSRVSADPSNPDVSLAGSLTEVLTLPRDETYGYNHQGGALAFGPDRKLYWTSGEHNNPSYAQDLQSPYGKVLRLNDDGSFPPDNPFYAQSTGWGRAVWALGLRNPYTFAFQPGTGRLLVNDVGGGLKEEVNLVEAGRNFGWPATEGDFDPAQYPQFTNPVHDYDRGTVGCAIIGAAFYDPPAGATDLFPAGYRGKYFFSDYCMRFIHVLDPQNGYAPGVFGTDNQLPGEAVDLEVGPDGALYGLARGSGGVVVRITYTGSDAPAISSDPRSQTATVGNPVSFEVSASGAAPLAYRWQRKDAGAGSFIDVPGATSSVYTIDAVAAGDDGAQFRCVVSNASGSATSAAATLTVTSNRPPQVQINFPAEGALYSAGQTVQYAGTAADPEEGSLPSSAYTWWVDLHHDTHHHPAVPPTGGSAFGSFVVPTVGETSANVWYRVHLRATDSQGLASEAFRDIRPRTSVFTLSTEPAGLSLTLDGAGVATPRATTGVVGITRMVGAPAAQSLNDTTYEFVSWSDGGTREHAISTPATDTTYTAVYRRVDVTAPSGSLSVQPVTAGGGAAHWFTVTYSDDVAVSLSTIGTGDIVVTGPNGFSQLATLSNLTVSSSSTPLPVTYRILAPGGTWDGGDNGTYTVSLVGGEVSDTSKNFASAAVLGSFSVNISDTTGPNAALAAPAVTSSGGTAYWLTVTYTDNTAVNLQTIGTGDIVVSGPGGFSQVATLSNLSPTSATQPVPVTYRILAPGGSWDAGDNGTYSVRMEPGQVADASGNFTAAGVIGTFTVNIPDTTPPTASAAPANITVTGQRAHWFTVTYTDNARIDYRTIDGGDVRVTGPSDFSQLAALSNLTAGADGRSLQVTYRVVASDGLWDASENGTYSLSLLANQIADMSRNFAPATPLGSFQVVIQSAGVGASAASPVIASSTRPRITLALLSTGDALRREDEALAVL